ncbi:MAG: AMP-binding protein, partial [Vicinamibacterales bacterium]
MSQIIERFSRILRDEPGRPLIHQPLIQKALTAEDLWDASVRQRSRLEQLGLGRDQLVIYAAGNRPDLPALWLAARSLGLSLMPMDAGAAPGEVASLANRFGASAVLVADTAALPLDIGDPAPYVPGLTVLKPRRSTDPPATYRGGAVLKLTSGSTGLPKATFTTDEQLVNDAEHIVRAMDIRPSDCQMAAIPLSHAYGIGSLLLPLLIQGTAVVLRDTFVPHQFVSDAKTYGARVFPGVPFMFDHFNAHLSPGAWPAGLEVLISAG